MTDSVDTTTVKINGEGRSVESVQSELDAVLRCPPSLVPRGIRLSPTWFERLGFSGSSASGGFYGAIPVAIAAGADFDLIEVVFSK